LVVVVAAELELDDVPAPVLFEELEEEADVAAENGLADPEPQPTIEATAKAATLNLRRTLEMKPTKPSKPCLQLTEFTVGFDLLWLYRASRLGVGGKLPRLF